MNQKAVKGNKAPKYPRAVDTAFCPVCEKLVRLMSFTESANLLETAVSDAQDLAERHVLHRVHNNRGEIMICSESIIACFREQETQPLDQNILFLRSFYCAKG
jgi:hypothetical protein